MENWIFFVIIAQMIWGFCCVFDKFVISKGHLKNPLSYIFFNGLMNIFVLAVIPFVSVSMLSFNDFLIMLFYGVGLSAAVSLYYKAVQYDEISRIKMMELSTPVLVMVSSYFLIGETLSKNQFISFAVFILAGLIVSYHNSSKGKFISRALLLVLGVAVIGSFTAVAAKHIYLNYNFWTAFVWLRISQFAALGVIFMRPVRRELSSFVFSNKVFWLMAIKMIIDFSAFIFVGIAIQNGPISLVSAGNLLFGTLFTFGLATLGTLLFPKLISEELDIKSLSIKLMAAALAVIGVIFAVV